MPGTGPQRRLNSKWVEARFDRIASSYWFFEKLFLVPRKSSTLAVERLELAPGDRVLSIGCGQGPLIPALSACVGPRGLVVGVDLSAGMLNKACKKVNEHGLQNVELLHMDVMGYKPSAPFNAILFSFSLTSFGDPKAVLEHAHAMLAPNGKIVVRDAQLPPQLSFITKPAMPLIRRFMEATVLGDPDMRPLVSLEELGHPVQVRYLRGGAYFVARVTLSS